MKIQIRSRTLAVIVSFAFSVLAPIAGDGITSADTIRSVQEVERFSVDSSGGPGCMGGLFGVWNVSKDGRNVYRLHKVVRHFDHGIETSRTVRVMTTANTSVMTTASLRRSEPGPSLDWMAVDWHDAATAETKEIPDDVTCYVRSRPRGSFSVSNEEATSLVELVRVRNGEEIRIDTLAISVARKPSDEEATIPFVIAALPNNQNLKIINSEEIAADVVPQPGTQKESE